MLKALNGIARAELRWPKVGSLARCSLCDKPNAFRFLGVHKGKGSWEDLGHPLTECAQMRASRAKEG